MFRLESVLQLKDEENLRAMARRHAITIIGPLFLAMLLIVIPFFFLFPLFSLGFFGVVLFICLLVSGILLAFRTFFLWDADVLIITDHRIVDVDQRGLFSRHVSEAPLSAIQDVSWKKQGIWQTMCGMGTVKIQTAGATAIIEADKIPKPERIHELINQARQEAPKHETTEEPTQKDRRSRIRHIAVLLEQADDAKVMEIETLLEKQSRDKAAQDFFGKTG
jgi:uncharacterized membrane protein YdbT with pleckstrin-like domain